jgi:hypothetical protein
MAEGIDFADILRSLICSFSVNHEANDLIWSDEPLGGNGFFQKESPRTTRG